MQFYKKTPEKNNNNEYLKMTSEIKNDLINNVCFECGAKDPQYISINNAIFICKDCIENHLSFSHNISQIIINDLFSLNLTEIKTLFYGGNRKLIQFINFDFPGLRQLPPEILYRTRAVDYYRKNLKFLVNGGKKPLRPGEKMAYKLVEYRDIILSPKNGKSEKYFNSTELTPILEGKDELDEIENNEDNDTFLEINKNFSDNTKNDSTMGNTPQKNKSENINDVNNINNNNSNSFFEKNANNISNIVNKYTKKNVRNKYKNKNKINNNEKEEIKDNSKNGDEIKLNIDKNISEIINNEENNNNNSNSNIKSSETNNNNLNDDVSGEDNTLKIVNGYINISRENEFSDFKSNKENNDYSNSFTKGKLEENNKDENKIKNQKMGRNNYNDKAFIKNDKKMKTEINIEKKYKKNKKEKNISDDENKDKEDINDDYFIIVDKKNDKEIKTSKKENKLHKNKIIKKNEYSEEEDEEEDDDEDDDEIKSEKLIYPINSKKVKNEKLNLTEIKPNRHLKVKISSSRIFNFNDDKDDNFNEKIKTKKIANKKEKRNRYVMASKEIITKKSKKDKDDFFSKKSSFGSGFINPLKYLQKSFQKKQNEKFEDSDTNEEEEEDSFEEEEISNKNKKYIKNGKIRKYKFEKEEK